jgi:hypothetical protein
MIIPVDFVKGTVKDWQEPNDNSFASAIDLPRVLCYF